MRTFTLDGNIYQCDDKYTHAAMDANGKVYAYEEEPVLSKCEGYWDYPEMVDKEAHKLALIEQIDWKETLVVL